MLDTSYQNLIVILGYLVELPDIVVWIRTPDYRHQLYVSPAFEKIWGRPIQTLFDNPLRWTEFLVQDERTKKINDLCGRNPFSPNRLRNTSYYRINHHPSGQIRYIRDTCFFLTNSKGKVIAIAGIAHEISESTWNDECATLENHAQNKVARPESIIAKILENQEGPLLPIFNNDNDGLPSNYVFLRSGDYIGLTGRENDCLRLLLQGKSSKEIARALSISPFTVDEYITNIKIKLNCRTKGEIFNLIHPAWFDMQVDATQ